MAIFEKFKRKDRGDREVAQRRAESIEALCESLRPLRPLLLKEKETVATHVLEERIDTKKVRNL